MYANSLLTYDNRFRTCFIKSQWFRCSSLMFLPEIYVYLLQACLSSFSPSCHMVLVLIPLWCQQLGSS